MNKVLGFLCLILFSLPCYAAIEYVPVQSSTTAGMYDPRNPRGDGPYKVISANPPVSSNVVQPAASTSYIIQLVRWGAPPNPNRVPMTADSTGVYHAYYRDAFTGVDFVAQASANNDQWFVRAIYPTTDGAASTTQLDGSPVIFYTSIGGYQDCFYSAGWLYYICGSPIIDIEFENQTQCEPAGNWTYQLVYNKSVVDQRTFAMALQIPPGDVPVALDQNPTKFGYVNGDYDDICNDSGKTVECNPSEPWPPYTLAEKACAMTCTAMVADYHGATIGEANLNAMNYYLTLHGGYTKTGDIVWPNVVPYGTSMGAQWNFLLIDKTLSDDNNLRNNICMYGVQIMGVSTNANAGGPGHFVVVYGKTQPSMAISTPWKVLDPDGGIDGTSVKYHNNDLGSRIYKGVAASYPFPIYGFEIDVFSPVDLVVTAPNGKDKTGYDPTSSTSYNGIANASYTSEGLDDDVTGVPDSDPMKIFYITGPATGTYTVQVIGTSTGTYDMQVTTLDANANRITSTELLDVPTTTGTIQQYSMNYGGIASTPITFNAGYAGGGQSKQVNSFLEYSSPAAARIKVSSNVTSYRVEIQYGSTIIPSTFSATLNGIDASFMFHPQPGTTEAVNVPLQPGSNKLLFKVQGVEANGHTATDRDSFTIISG